MWALISLARWKNLNRDRWDLEASTVRRVGENVTMSESAFVCLDADVAWIMNEVVEVKMVAV